MREVGRPNALLITLTAALLLCGCDTTKPVEDAGVESPTRPSPDLEQPPTPERPAEALAALPAKVRRGVCYAHNWQLMGAKGYGSAASAEALAHLAGIGVTWVSITPFAWMKDRNSTEIGGEHNSAMMPPGAETRERVIGAITQAREHGLKIQLKPHIWVGRGDWRGSIAPKGDQGQTDWKTWWESYRAFILYYAKLAEETGAESFVIGVELVSAVKANPDELSDTIAAVREVYSGEITYSANWDEDVPDNLWREMDAVGVQLYPPLSDADDPSVDELVRALEPHMRRLDELSRRVDKPILLTEVGYKSAPTAVKEPFGWPEDLPAELRTSDEAIQATAYEALLSTLPAYDRIEGIFIWKYFSDAETDEEGVFGFSPRGKAAEAVLERAYAPPRQGE